jgi:hypothetical protein
MQAIANFSKKTPGDFAVLTSIVSDYEGVGGTITSNPAGINCPGDCTEIYSLDSSVTLTAQANTASDFIGWSGDCSGTGTCTITKENAVHFDGENYTAAVMAQFLPKTSPAGTLAITSSSCAFKGIYGIDLREYQVIITGTASGPAGSKVIITKGSGGWIRGETLCGAWTYDGYDCNRGAGQPDSTTWSFAYGFYDQRTSLVYTPYVSIDDDLGYLLDSKDVPMTCQ